MQVRLLFNIGRRDADSVGLDHESAKAGSVHFLPEKTALALIDRNWAVLISEDSPRRVGRPPGRPPKQQEVRAIPHLDIESTEFHGEVEEVQE